MKSDDPVSPLSAQASSRTEEARTDFPLLRLPTSETLYSSICIIKRCCKARGEAWRTLGHTCGLIVGRNLENNTYSCALTRRTLRCGDAVELMMWSDKTIRLYGQSELGN